MIEEKKLIKQLGVKEGKLLFFGGVYSNLQSLEALKQWADSNGYSPDSIFCTGDILGYCAQPVECIKLIQTWGIHAIAGNVELQLRNGEDDCGCDFRSGGRCDLFSRNWYQYTRRKMRDDLVDWLHTLPHHLTFTYAAKKVLLVHGSWFHTSEFVFRSTPWERKEKDFAETGADVIVAGHCGLPFADEQDGKLWLNAGVIGMPANDGTDRVWFLTMEQEGSERLDYAFRSHSYNNGLASQLMRQHGLPSTYADTLLTGIWDNCEILPEEETGQQGKALLF